MPLGGFADCCDRRHGIPALDNESWYAWFLRDVSLGVHID